MVKTSLDDGIRDHVPVGFQPRNGRSIGEGAMRVKEEEGENFFMAILPEAWYIPSHGKFWKNGEPVPRFSGQCGGPSPDFQLRGEKVDGGSRSQEDFFHQGRRHPQG